MTATNVFFRVIGAFDRLGWDELTADFFATRHCYLIYPFVLK